MSELFPSDTILAISLWQPWAQLWLTSAKPNETRGWPFPEKYRGEECLVHAAKRPIERDLFPELEKICADRFGRDWRTRLQRGGFVGKLTLQDCTRMTGRPDGAMPAHEADEICGDWSPGRCAWRRAEGQAMYTDIIPAIGRQGFWRVPRSLLGEASA